MIQRPGDSAPKASASSSYAAPRASASSSNGSGSRSSSKSVSGDVADQVRQLLSQGYRIGMEHVDARRFRTGTWKNCAPVQSTRPNDVMAALSACMAEHQGEYVRLIGIDTKSKKRVAEIMVQRP